MTYLDWAATSPPDAAILAEAARLACERYGNPSSRHGPGLEARAALEEARARLAAAITASPSSGRVAFTGGGTEADSIALLTVLRQALNARRDGSIKRLHIVTTEIEHAAVYEEALLLKSLGLALSFVACEADGRVDPRKLGAAIERDTALVAVMAVNNETGAIQPVAEISRAIAEAAAAFGRPPPRLHVDAVQALGKVPFDPVAAGASSAAYSAHKIRGPRGVGALWVGRDPKVGRDQKVARDPKSPFEPLSVGGGQEGATRPGTESLQGACAFAAAASSYQASFAQRVLRARTLEARLIAGILSIPGALPLPLGRRAGDERYSPFIVSAAFPGLSGEVLARALSDSGFAVSTGSACSGNSRRPGRRVLQALGLSEELSLSAIRASTGESSTVEEVDEFLEAAAGLYRKLKT
jgi:cysteine desulfurase